MSVFVSAFATETRPSTIGLLDCCFKVHPDGHADVRYDDDSSIEKVRCKFLKVDGKLVVPPATTPNTNDAEPEPPAKRGRGGKARAAGGGGGAGSSAGVEAPTRAVCDSLKVLRLCGRLLATSLVLGDGYFVDECAAAHRSGGLHLSSPPPKQRPSPLGSD